MNEHPFQFAVLRYVHDPVTQEFINVGIVIYSPEARYLRASINSLYARLSDTFQEINGEYYRRLVDFLERRFAQLGYDMREPKLFEEMPPQIEVILAHVIPPDDSSLVFGGYGSGLSDDLDRELSVLYGRLVARYASREERASRDDAQVWSVFRRELDRHDIVPHLQPVTIRTDKYKHTFDYAWRNERYHPIEPVSFDLLIAQSIRNKADRWIGRTVNLSKSPDMGKLYLLLGAPSAPTLLDEYRNAVDNLDAYIPIEHEIVEESDAASFSRKLARMIAEHQQDPE